jgi:hypothetical protein
MLHEWKYMEISSGGASFLNRIGRKRERRNITGIGPSLYICSSIWKRWGKNLPAWWGISMRTEDSHMNINPGYSTCCVRLGYLLLGRK